MTKIVVYGTEHCPKCNRLKAYLDSHGLKYSVRDMQDPKAMAILMSMNVFTRDAPVLDADGTYLESSDLFHGTELDRALVNYWLGIDVGME